MTARQLLLRGGQEQQALASGWSRDALDQHRPGVAGGRDAKCDPCQQRIVTGAHLDTKRIACMNVGRDCYFQAQYDRWCGGPKHG
jgi:hypothetical protein